ncbi:zinc-dependent metalloprotease family protein [Fontivita pretiosa]|uniref:zinc-dependent metalloprotease family protein n=1 Tax=Fontivita pretiosa TaxID=2989684 RepID=UPI003D184B5E
MDQRSAVTTAAGAQALAAGRFPLSTLPQLSSRPGAPVTVWLDFDGTPAFDWAGGGGNRRVHGPAAGTDDPVPAFSLDANTNDYTQGELDAIDLIWRQVSEKFSPFNINVTTVAPPNLNDGAAIQMVIGGSNSDWYGSGGGVAPINGFTNGNSNTGFVWSADAIDAGSTTISTGDRHFIAETAAHEAGHLFGLEHQSVIDGMNNVLIEYSNGGPTTSPIMGNSSNNSTRRGIWFSGPSSRRDNNNNLVYAGPQDDLGVLTHAGNFITYRPDDFGDFSGSGTLNVNTQTGVATGGGVIQTNGDRDAFTFVAIGPVLSFTVNNFAEGGMLAPTLELIPLGSGGNPSWSVTTTNTSATLSTTNAVPGGGYVLRVSPQFNEYGSLGQYSITGNVGVFAGLNGTQLVVTGYNANNDIGISYHSSTDRIVLQNDVFGGSAVQQFPRSSVTSIVVNTPGGNDMIDVFGQFSVLNIPITVNAGGGDDYLIFQGTTGNDLQILETGSFGRNNQTPVTFRDVERFVMSAFDGYDTQRLHEVPASLSVTVYGGGHDDGFDLGWGDVERIRGPVNYSGDGGYDTFVVQNEWASGDWYHSIGSNYVSNNKDGFSHDTYVNTTERIIIGASHNNDTMYASPFANFSYIMYGRGGHDTFDIQGGSGGANLYGGDGNDRFYFGGGNLLSSVSNVYAYGEAGDDVMVLDDHNSTHDLPWAVFGNTGDPNTANTVFLGLNAYTYSAFEGVEVLGGNGNNDFQIYSSSVPVTLRGGGGNDQFRFLQTTGGIWDMAIDGQAGLDVLTADDRNFAPGISVMELTDTYLRRWAGWGIFSVPYTSSYSNIEAMNYYAHASATTTYVYSTSSAISAGQQYSLFLNSGADFIAVYTQDSSGNLTINGNLGISGGGGVDSIYVNSSYGPDAMNYSFSNTYGPGTQNIYGVGAAGMGTAAVENINVIGGAADDTFNVNQYSSGTALAVYGGEGNDTFRFGNNNLQANLTNASLCLFDGQGGADTAIIDNLNNANGWNYYSYAGSFVSATSGYSWTLSHGGVEQIAVNAGPAGDSFNIDTLSVGNSLVLNGGGGYDTLDAGRMVATGSFTIAGIQGPILYDAGAGGGRIRMWNNFGSGARTTHVDAASIGAWPADSLFSPGAYIQFSGISDNGSTPGLDLMFGRGSDTIYARPLANATVVINGGAQGTPGDQLNLALADAQGYSINPTSATTGNVTSSNLKTLWWSNIEEPIGVDDVAPVVVAADINLNGIAMPGVLEGTVVRQSLDVQFSEDVSALIHPSWIELTNLTSGETIPWTNIAVEFDAATNIAHFTFPGYPDGVLPSGNYAGRVYAGLPDFFGNAMPADAPFEFFFLAGDANHDRFVDANDLDIITGNWQGGGKLFSEGDLNYDGTVNARDLYVLASNWQAYLPPPQLILSAGKIAKDRTEFTVDELING